MQRNKENINRETGRMSFIIFKKNRSNISVDFEIFKTLINLIYVRKSIFDNNLGKDK